MKTARIIGTGSYLPKRLITNEDLEKIVRNFDTKKAGMPFLDWAFQMTGIRQRYYVEDEDTESMAALASARALAAARISAQEIDFIIACSFTPSKDIPNLACTIANSIGNKKIPGFPLNTACAGFVYGLAVGYGLIRAQLYKRILVVASETLSRVTDYADPKTAVLFGDGAGALILEAADEGGISSAPYLSSEYSEHFELGHTASCQASGILTAGEKEYIQRAYLRMPGGPRVLKKAIHAMSEAAGIALQRSRYKLQDIDYIVPHQANQRITTGLVEALGVPKEKVCATIERYGNTSGASVAIALDKALRGENATVIKRGDKLVLTAVGAGYSVGAVVLEY
jgi:3-oxoacyl-[acyl-carrier-protein] synthase-3